MHKSELKRRLDVLDELYHADSWDETYTEVLLAIADHTWLYKLFVPRNVFQTHENVAKEIKWYLERLEMLESKRLWTRLKAMAGWK